MTSATKYLLYSLAAIQLTNIVDFMVIMPLAPMLEENLSINATEFSWLVSIYAFSAGLTGVAATFFIDRFPRKSMLLWVYAEFAIATLICALANSFSLLLIGRMMAGIGGGLLTILINTIVAEQVPYAERGRAMGIVMSAFSVASVIGVPLGLIVANFYQSWGAPFYGLSTLSIIVGVWSYLSMRKVEFHSPSISTIHRFPLLKVLSIPKHWLAYAFMACTMLSAFSVIPYITLYSTSNVGITLAQIPWVYLIGGACTFVSLHWVGRLSDVYGKHKIYCVLAVFSMFIITLLTRAQHMAFAYWLIITTSFFVIVSGRGVPAMALLSEIPPPALRSAFLALLQSIISIMQGLGAIIAGHILVQEKGTGVYLHYEVVGMVSIAFVAMGIILIQFIHALKSTHQPQQT